MAIACVLLLRGGPADRAEPAPGDLPPALAQALGLVKEPKESAPRAVLTSPVL